MHSFAEGFYRRHRLTHQLAQTLRQLGEHKGRETLFLRRFPEVLEGLRRAATIESTESSNRIEGILASRERVEELVEGEEDAPRDRPEQEIAGYRDVLATLYTRHENIPFSTGVVLQFHRDLYGFTPQDGGRWKAVDNEISETLPSGERRLRFRTVSAFATSSSMEELHRRYEHRRQEGEIEPLLLLASYVLDFLCIHPFLDGNGRMARLLTLLGLYREGYGVGRYISLERIVETHKEGYYQSLARSSEGWHEGQHNPVPWWEYFLGVMLLGAYRELERRTEGITQARGAKTALVEAAVRRLPEEFRIQDVLRACPGVSRPTVGRVLRDLRGRGVIELQEVGRGASWLRLEDR